MRHALSSCPKASSKNFSSTVYAPVAQLDRASACGAEGHRFESCRVYQVKTPTLRRSFYLVDSHSESEPSRFVEAQHSEKSAKHFSSKQAEKRVWIKRLSMK